MITSTKPQESNHETHERHERKTEERNKSGEESPHSRPDLFLSCLSCVSWFNSSSSRFELPLAAHGAAEHLVGVVVVELLLDRVPLQLLAAQAQRDHADVADRHRTMADRHRTDTRLARLDAVQPVTHVVVRDVQLHA